MSNFKLLRTEEMREYRTQVETLLKHDLSYRESFQMEALRISLRNEEPVYNGHFETFLSLRSRYLFGE